MTPYEIEQFLYHEARLLDAGQFEAWFALFTEDAVYWVPAGRDDIDPTRHVSIIYDDHARLQKRIARLYSGHAYAQDPASEDAPNRVECRAGGGWGRMRWRCRR